MANFTFTDKKTGQATKVEAESRELAIEKFKSQNSIGGLTGLMMAGDRNVKERIIDRGNVSFAEQTKEIKNRVGFVPKSLAILKLASMPLERVEAAIANSMMAIQDGNWDEVGNQFQLGMHGEQLGEIGDVFRKAGVPEPIAATGGFIVSLVSPITLVNKGLKVLKGVSHLKTDKGIKIAGEMLVKGSNEAVVVVGKNLDKAYGVINDVPVNPDKFLKSLDAAPNILIKNIEEELGKNIEDIIINPKISDVRTMKTLIGKLNLNSFGKEAKGLSETIEVEKVNKTYGRLKNLIQDTLTDGNMKEEAKNLLQADETFTKIKRASDFIKRTVTDKTLVKPTKAGKIARGLEVEGNLTSRDALRTLTTANSVVKKEITNAVNLLQKYNWDIWKGQALRAAGRAVVYGGVAGAVTGKVMNTVQGRE